MTKEEALSVLVEAYTAKKTCETQLNVISEKYTALCDAECKPLNEQKDRLRQHIQEFENRVSREGDFLPFQPHDFIANESGDYYEVVRWSIRLDRDTQQLEPTMQAIAIRKGGTLARYATAFRYYAAMRKVDASEHLCLRRRLKQALRTRLEGGE